MKYSPRPFERLLTRFIARQTKIIEQLINQFVSDATMQTTRVLPQKTEGDFFFRDYPALSRQIDTLLRGLSSRLTRTIQAGCEWSWDLANAKNDNMLSKVLDSIGRERVQLKALERWNQKNLPALEAFEKRRIGGMGLSDKVWAYTKGIKGDLELALDLGIGQGMSADRLSRVVREYLKEPNRLYRRVRDEKGVLRLSKSAANYHPGQGVYRSSYKNAVRLTATETNMAYRSADNERMNQMEWILGFEVHISDTNHTCLDSHGVPQPFYDICDELQGRYPKWFRFVGWHPNCRCYITTILPEKDEMIKYLAAMDENGHSSYKLQGEVTDVPPQMKEWLIDNQYRVIKAKSLPYWIKDNPQISISREMTQSIKEKSLALKRVNEARNELTSIFQDARKNGSLKQEQIERLHEIAPNVITEGLFETNDGGYVASRNVLHEEIISQYVGDGSVRGDTVYMLGGAPANGKSTVVDSGMIAYPKGVITLDVDKVKRMIPEYGLSEASSVIAVRNNAANFVHEESSYLGKQIQKKVLSSGETIVIDGVNDGSYEKVAKKVATIREQSGGLRVRADYVTCDTEESIRRNQARFERTGRLVRPDVVVHDNAAISKLFPKLIENNVFDELYLWDTNSPNGARLVLRMVGGKLEIIDQELYKRFLAKAGV